MTLPRVACAARPPTLLVHAAAAPLDPPLPPSPSVQRTLGRTAPTPLSTASASASPSSVRPPRGQYSPSANDPQCWLPYAWAAGLPVVALPSPTQTSPAWRHSAGCCAACCHACLLHACCCTQRSSAVSPQKQRPKPDATAAPTAAPTAVPCRPCLACSGGRRPGARAGAAHLWRYRRAAQP